MNDVDELLRTELDRAFPPAADGPDWDAVLRRLRRPRRRRRTTAAAGLALAAAAAAAAALAPWHGGPSFTARALAAIGTERYVVAVVEPAREYGSVVDLETGAARPERIRTVYVLDSGSSERIPTLSSWRTLDGVSLDSTDQGNPADEPGLATFVGGYRKALADGTAKVVGETTFRGRRAKVVRFSFDYATALNGKGLATRVHDPGGATEDVAVDAATYRPLWVDRTETVIGGGRTVRYRQGRDLIVSIRSTGRPPAHPPDAQSRFVMARPALNGVTRAAAPLALGSRAAWPGASVGGLGFRSVRLDQLWPAGASGYGASAPALRLAYAGGGRTLVVRESARLQPDGYPELEPPAGKVRLSCYGCGVAGWSASRTVWLGRLRRGPLHLTIEAPTRALVLAAARALRPMP